MTKIKYKDKVILFGTYDVFELEDIIKEFNNRYNLGLILKKRD